MFDINNIRTTVDTNVDTPNVHAKTTIFVKCITDKSINKIIIINLGILKPIEKSITQTYTNNDTIKNTWLNTKNKSINIIIDKNNNIGCLIFIVSFLPVS
jgi:hypothetical protein